MSREELKQLLEDYGESQIEDFLEHKLIKLTNEEARPVNPSDRLEFIMKKIENNKRLLLIDKVHFLIAQDDEKIKLRYISTWDIKKIREISDRLYLKRALPSKPPQACMQFQISFILTL